MARSVESFSAHKAIDSSEIHFNLSGQPARFAQRHKIAFPIGKPACSRKHIDSFFSDDDVSRDQGLVPQQRGEATVSLGLAGASFHELRTV